MGAIKFYFPIPRLPDEGLAAAETKNLRAIEEFINTYTMRVDAISGAVALPATSTMGGTTIDVDGHTHVEAEVTDLAHTAGGIANVVEDTTPQLGGNLDMNAKGITFPAATITDMLDEDAMGSDSATKGATQQSIKAYIDAQIALQMPLTTLFPVVFSKPPGVIVVETAVYRWTNNSGHALTLAKVGAECGLAGTGTGNNAVDVNIDGTTAFTTQSNRPLLAAAAVEDVASTVQNDAVADGATVTIDIDEVTATTGCEDLTVTLWLSYD